MNGFHPDPDSSGSEAGRTGLILPPLSLLYLSQTAKFKSPDVVLGLGFYLFHDPLLDFLVTKGQ